MFMNSCLSISKKIMVSPLEKVVFASSVHLVYIRNKNL